LKKANGVNPLDLKYRTPETDAIRQKIAEASAAAELKKQEVLRYFGGDEFKMESGLRTGEGMADLLMGRHPAAASFEDVTDLKNAGVPGMKNDSYSTGRTAHNYAIWDRDLINQMRVRAIDGEFVPINPTTLVQQVEQPTFRAAAGDSPLVSTMNPMRPQAVPSVLKPLAAGAAYNALARQNQYGGIL
jgi:hypothetical protein